MVPSRGRYKESRREGQIKPNIDALNHVLAQKMDSPRMGGRGRNSAAGTPRMGTPAGDRIGAFGTFAAPAQKGTVTLGKGKGRLRAGMDTSISGPHATSSMLLPHEDSYEVIDNTGATTGLAIPPVGGPTGNRERGRLADSASMYTPEVRTEGEKGKIFAKSDETVVRLHENLPIDVQRAMGVDNAWKDIYIGGYDTATGYAWIASCRNTWLWKNHRNPPVPPTVHIFASPPSQQPGDESAPHVVILPVQSNASTEPALVLISPTGTVRLWSSIFLGLAGAERFVELIVPLLPSNKKGNMESISTAKALVPSLALNATRNSAQASMNSEVILGTSRGRTFRISALRQSETGEWSLSAKEITLKPTKSSSFLSNWFTFGSSSEPSTPRFGISSSGTSGNGALVSMAGVGGSWIEGDGVVDVAMGNVGPDGIDVWVLTSSTLVVWRISENNSATGATGTTGNERLLGAADVINGISEKLLKFYHLDDQDDSDVTQQDIDMLTEGPDVGINLAGGLSSRAEQRERRLLEFAPEVLDIVLIKSSEQVIDPKEPLLVGMDATNHKNDEELTPVLLAAYYAPPSRSTGSENADPENPDGVALLPTHPVSIHPPPRKTGQYKERSYMTISCSFVGVEGLAGTRPSPVKLENPVLQFGEPRPLPYTDYSKSGGLSVSGLNRGVNISGAPMHKAGWFPPKMSVLQAEVVVASKKNPLGRELSQTIRQESSDSEDEEMISRTVEENRRDVCVLAVGFEDAMILSSLDGTFHNHLYMKTSHPFPKTVGFGAVGSNPKTGSNYLPYSLSAARMSSNSLMHSGLRGLHSPLGQQFNTSQTQLNLSSASGSAIGEICYLTTLGIVSISVDFKQVARANERAGGVKHITSIMEQAVLYGPVPDNPFTFRFSSTIDAGQLMLAAGQLSLKTIQPNPKLVKKQLGVTTQLADRAARLEWLIRFINDNGALTRISRYVRETLFKHAEKIAAAQGVWVWYDTTLKGNANSDRNGRAPSHSRDVERSRNILVQAVDALLRDEQSPWSAVDRRVGYDEGYEQGIRNGGRVSPNSHMADVYAYGSDEEPLPHNQQGANWPSRSATGARNDQLVEYTGRTGYVDPVRRFFRDNLEDIGRLASGAQVVVRDTLGSFERAQAWPDVAIQAGRLYLIMLEAALIFRDTHSRTYGLDLERAATMPWPAATHLAEQGVYFFDECARTGNDVVPHSETRSVLEGLATIVCEIYKLRIVATKSLEPHKVAELQEDFTRTRREMWSTLVDHGCSEHAYTLAEECGDFRALTELSYQAATKGKRSATGAKVSVLDRPAVDSKIKQYMDRYKQEFAFELYHWWIEKGMAREIFKQTGSQLHYVEAFFTTFDYPRLNWLHLISKKQFSAASSTLLSLGRAEPELDQAKFMLSMGKLCELVEHDRAATKALTRTGATGVPSTSADTDVDEEIQNYDENLELLDVQLKLRDDLLAMISDIDVAGTIQVADVGAVNEEILAKARAITERATTQLAAGGRTGLVTLFKRLVGNLIAGRRLGVEETMDVLTLQDNSFSVNNFTVALHLIYQSRTLGVERRDAAFRALWRRIYIHDDWNSLQDTRAYSDAQVTERLRSTALFSALRELYTGSLSSLIDPESLSKIVYRPTEATVIPNGEDLIERYSRVEYFGTGGLAPFTKEDVAAFIRDLEGEREALDDYVGVLEDGGLWDEVARIEESERPESMYENLEEQASEEDEDEDEDGSVPVERGNSLGIDVSMEG